MGYPRKSYPHRCPPSCAKRSRPRACARVYIIYRSPVGRSRGVSAPLCPRVPRRRAQGGGGRRQRRTPPRAVPNHAACVSNHCVQRRKCTRPTPPLPVRSPRDSLSTAAPSPADGRSAERKGGSAQGNPRPCPCVLPAATCLRPRSRPLMGEAPSAGWGRAKAKADAPSHSNPPLPVRSPRPCLPTAPPPPPKWAPPPPQAGGKTTEWRTAAPHRPHIERREETILAQFAYQDAKAHKALCTICDFRLHALQAFAQLFHSLAQIAPQRPEKSINCRPKA